MKVITKDNFDKFTYTNAELLKKTPRAIVVEFHGLGDGRNEITEHTKLSYFFAEHDILYMLPYYGPWSWMNMRSVAITDEIIDAILEHFSIGSLPVASTGLSMGGQGALIYTLRSKHPVKACATLCPVCDLVYHFTERRDTARSIYNAHYSFDMPFEKALELASPIHQTDKMPDIPYFIIAATADKDVNCEKHALAFTEKMKKYNKTVTVFSDEGQGHCDATPDAVNAYKNFIVDALN